MDFTRLNPVVRSAGIYEKITNKGECIAYDSRLLYLISGDVTVEVEGQKKTHLFPGNALYIPPMKKYKIKAKYVRIAFFTFDVTCEMPDPVEKIVPDTPDAFNKEKAHVFADVSPFDQYMLLPDMEGERDKIIRMCNLATSAEGEWRAQISAELKLILLKLAESVSESALPARMVEELDNYIRENSHDEISNTEIGAIFGYHPFYVSRMLKDKKGITLRQYVIAYRFKAAKKLLELTDKSIGEIAEECGFTDSSYFAKSFKAAFGITPKEYRNSFEDKPI